MKKLIAITLILTALVACKDETKKEVVVEEASEVNDDKIGAKQLQGEFIYYGDAAVLQTRNEVYGVVIDSMMHVLQEQVKSYKKEVTDMVPVVIKAHVFAKEEDQEGWPYKVEVLEVVKVFPPKPDNNNVIKLQNETK